jgi:hypothetical protein
LYGNYTDHQLKTNFSVDKGIQSAVKIVQFIGFEVLTAVTMKITIFWDAIQCSLVKVQTFWRNILHPSSGSKDQPHQSPGRSRWQTVC